MTDSFRNLLFWASLFGLPMMGTCATGCNNGDGGAYTMTDYLDDMDSHGIEWDGELELDRPARAAVETAVSADSGFRFKVRANNRGKRYPVLKNDETDAKTEDETETTTDMKETEQ